MLEIRLLGPVELLHDGVVVELGRRQERCVLGLLALEPGRVVPADRLIELLWGTAPPPSARAALQSHIARLRGRLATDRPLILTKGAGYLVDIEPDLVDVHRFVSVLDDAQRDPSPVSRAAKLTVALSLWRGPLLAGAADDDLRARLNVGLQEQFLLAHELFAEAELANGRHHHLLASLPELLDRHPGRERLALLLMHARYRDHDVAGAMATFDYVRRHLAEELGLDPGPELVELQRALLNRDVPPPVRDRFPATVPTRPSIPIPRQLPPDVLGFAGREAELRRLEEILVESAAQQPTAVTISALAGTAGIGKTTLAVHWAHRLADRYPDGALYVNLRGFDASAPATGPDEALRGFLDALGVAAHQIPASVSARTGLYRTLLDGRRVLVVLDNARDADQVRPLLPGSAGCLAIVTSRYQLYSLDRRGCAAADGRVAHARRGSAGARPSHRPGEGCRGTRGGAGDPLPLRRPSPGPGARGGKGRRPSRHAPGASGRRTEPRAETAGRVQQRRRQHRRASRLLVVVCGGQPARGCPVPGARAASVRAHRGPGRGEPHRRRPRRDPGPAVRTGACPPDHAGGARPLRHARPPPRLCPRAGDRAGGQQQ